VHRDIKPANIFITERKAGQGCWISGLGEDDRTGMSGSELETALSVDR